MAEITGSPVRVVVLTDEQIEALRQLDLDYEDSYRRMTSARTAKSDILRKIAAPESDRMDWKLDSSGKFLLVERGRG